MTTESEYECLICFCPIEGQIYSCASPLCSAKTCDECTEALINFSAKNDSMPKCPAKSCDSYYILSGLVGLSSEVIAAYEMGCLAHMLKDKGDAVQKKLEEEAILEKLRQERSKFIKETYPAAIALVATIAFTTKLRHLEKQKSKFIQEKINASHRICMNSYCNGHLDSNLVCMVCLTKFCQKCEKVLKENHKCNQADIDSIGFIKNMIKCPKCQIPVQRSEGCNHMTCANCDTKFYYNTGEEGGGGSHNPKVSVMNKIKLSYAYKDIITEREQINLLLKIEAMEPPMITESAIFTSLRYYYQTDNKLTDKQVIAKQLARKIDVYMKTKYHNQQFQNLLGEIEALVTKKELTVDKLTDIYNLLRVSAKNIKKKNIKKKSEKSNHLVINDKTVKIKKI